MIRGPGFTTTDLITIGLFAFNYAVVAPLSVILCIVGFVMRKRRRPTFLLPVAVLNILVAAPQLALIGDAEWWLRALIAAQLLLAIAVLWFVGIRSPR